MPVFSLDLRRIDYRSDHRMAVSAWRGFIDVLFETSKGAVVSFSCIMDSGAPFSVLPFSLWNDCDLKWTPRGTQLTRRGGVTPELLEWQGTRYTLGETSGHLTDLHANVKAGPLIVVAKFVNHRQTRAQLEMTAVLGMNFLVDNKLQFSLDGTTGKLIGRLDCP